MKTRVDALLRVRAIERDQRARELALAQDAVDAARVEAETVARGVAQARGDYERARQSPVGAEVVHLFETWFESRRSELARLQHRIEDLLREVDRRRAALTATAQELDSYERYRDGLIEEHQQDVRSRETRHLDEFALRSFSRPGG